ncbi:MAG: outer membrane lipoprotein carrier protein LolA [Candidatus Binatia bacterium]|nr:outer membrane lipoprotein carrier protein LolA [Candidatus Binatia bacterium]
MKSPLKPWLLFAAVALGVAHSSRTVGESTPEQAGVGAIVARVQERYDATRDLTADVTQETVLTRLNKRVTASGTVAFRKPGKMRWELTNGQKEVIVSDGQTLWIYRPEDQQVIRIRFAQAFRSNMPVSFLTGVGRIAEDFIPSLEPAAGTHLRLRLVPKRGDADVGVLWLDVDPTTYDIVGAEVKDPLGNTSKLTLQNIKRNTGLSDGVFQFEVPPGVDVLDAPQG